MVSQWSFLCPMVIIPGTSFTSPSLGPCPLPLGELRDGTQICGCLVNLELPRLLHMYAIVVFDMVKPGPSPNVCLLGMVSSLDFRAAQDDWPILQFAKFCQISHPIVILHYPFSSVRLMPQSPVTSSMSDPKHWSECAKFTRPMESNGSMLMIVNSGIHYTLDRCCMVL